MAALWPVRVGADAERTTDRALPAAGEVDTRGHEEDLLRKDGSVTVKLQCDGEVVVEQVPCCGNRSVGNFPVRNGAGWI